MKKATAMEAGAAAMGETTITEPAVEERASSPVAAPEETRGPEVRTAVALRDITWVQDGKVYRMRMGEQMPVARGSALWERIQGRQIAACWADAVSEIVPCPGRIISVACGTPLMKSEVRAGTLLRRNLRRAARDITFPHQGQLFQLAVGDIAEQKLALHMVDVVIGNMLPESFTTTTLALYRVTCPNCGIVDVAIEAEE